ncbi:platelet-activating factor acetyltransferase [Mactra antiquata]
MSSKSTPADIPQPVNDIQGDDRWMSQHKRFVLSTKEGEPEVVFIGDSLIQQLSQTELWNRMFEPLHCINFGIGGDQTQHVLWRVQNGEMDCITPKVIVLLVGTNNYDHKAEEVVDGIVAIAKCITQKQPKAELIVMGLPPRGEKPNKLRDKIATINAKLAVDIEKVPGNVTFLPIDPSLFVNSEGFISHQDMYDYVHFTNKGYNKLFEQLLDLVQDLLHEFVKVENTSQDTDSIAGELATRIP